MKLDTKSLILKSHHYGDIEYSIDEVINFDKGMLGFENLKKFILRDVDNSSFKILHALEDFKIAFVMINPFDFIKDYEINLDDKTIKDLEVESAKSVMVLNTVTLNSDISKITTNLRAPIIVNIETNKAEQVILKTEKYAIKHRLMEE